MVVVRRCGSQHSVPAGRPPVAGDRGCWAKERFCHRRRRASEIVGLRRLLDTAAWRSPATRCWPSGCTRRSSTASPVRRDRRGGARPRGPGHRTRRGALGARRCAAPPPTRATCSPPGRCAGRRTSTAGRRRRRSPAAVAPWSEADAAKRVFDASRPLKEAGIPVLDALDRIAGEMRDIAATPGGQGRDVDRAAPPAARALPALVPGVRGRAPLRAAVPPRRPARAGSSSSPAPLPRSWSASRAGAARPSGPTRRSTSVRGRAAAAGAGDARSRWRSYVDAPVKDVKAHWPDDVVPGSGRRRGAVRSLEADLDALAVATRRLGRRRACSARSTCSSSRATARSSYPTRRTARTSGAPSADPAAILVGHEVLGSLASAGVGQEAAHRGERVGSAPRPHRAGRAAGRLPRASPSTASSTPELAVAALGQPHGAGGVRVAARAGGSPPSCTSGCSARCARR